MGGCGRGELLSPPAEEGVEVLKGWRNQAPAPKQADALTTDALARIRETARLPRRGRGGAWSQQPSHRLGAPSTWQASE